SSPPSTVNCCYPTVSPTLAERGAATREAQPVASAIDAAWDDVQVLKEEISKLISPLRYDWDIAIPKIAGAAAQLVDSYGHVGARLSEAARIAWHRAKGNSQQLLQMLETADEAGQAPSAEHPVSDQLRELRNNLTECQSILARERTKLIQEQVEQMVQVLR
ncbi:MAG: hypothetical protein ACHQ9S_23050, partial [Candidatus Binatia bacterium]